MADTAPISKVHWVLYSVLGIVVIFLVWLWHDTAIKDAAALQAVATAKQNQATADKQAIDTTAAASADLAKKNKLLQQQLAAAKTASAQAALINAQEGTHIGVTTPSQQNPSLPPTITLPATDLPILATEATKCQECENQVEADALEQAAEKIQLAARDQTIKADEKELQALKGGSHWQRFWKATEHIGIGIAIGVAADEAIRKANGK